MAVIESCGTSYFNLYCLTAPPDRLDTKLYTNHRKHLFKICQSSILITVYLCVEQQQPSVGGVFGSSPESF